MVIRTVWLLVFLLSCPSFPLSFLSLPLWFNCCQSSCRFANHGYSSSFFGQTSQGTTGYGLESSRHLPSRCSAGGYLDSCLALPVPSDSSTILVQAAYDSLPLGARVEHFAPENVFCPHCPYVVQSTSHFAFSCPLAQQVWQDFASCFHLPHSPFLHHVLFSWPSSSSSVLGHAYGFRLQAGHAVAIHTL